MTFVMLNLPVVRTLLYKSQKEISLTCSVLAPIYSQLRPVNVTTVGILGGAKRKTEMLGV